MKLCGITCDGWTITGKAAAEFSLSATTVTDAAAIDGQDLIVTEDDGETVVASFAGYGVTAVYKSGDSVRLRAARELSTEAAEAIHAVEQNMTVLSATVNNASAKADTAQTAAQEAKTAADTAAASVNEYMDALLGLDSIATNETEETDAE